MQITNFTLGEPDDDGDVRYEVEAESVNTSTRDIYLLVKESIFINGRGAAFERVTEREQVRIEPGEAFAMTPYHGHIHQSHVGTGADDVTLELHLTQCAREFHALGSCPLPADHTQASQLDTTLVSDCLAPDLKAVVSRSKADPDGDVRVQVNALMRRLSDRQVRDIAWRAELIDAEGAVMAVEESDASLTVEQREMVEMRLPFMRTGRLKGATLRFSLMAYVPVRVEMCQSLSTPGF